MYDPRFKYYSAAGAQAPTLTSGIQSYTKVNDESVQLTTKIPDAHLPSDLTTVYLASPTAVEEEGTRVQQQSGRHRAVHVQVRDRAASWFSARTSSTGLARPS